MGNLNSARRFGTIAELKGHAAFSSWSDIGQEWLIVHSSAQPASNRVDALPSPCMNWWLSGGGRAHWHFRDTRNACTVLAFCQLDLHPRLSRLGLAKPLAVAPSQWSWRTARSLRVAGVLGPPRTPVRHASSFTLPEGASFTAMAVRFGKSKTSQSSLRLEVPVRMAFLLRDWR